MVGACNPAAAAMSVKRAWNGSPEGLPRGKGLRDRVEMPCAQAPTPDSASSFSQSRRRCTPPVYRAGRQRRSDDEAAADINALPGYESGAIGAQKGNHVGDIL